MSQTSKTSSLKERLEHFWHKEIWATVHLKDNSPKGWGYAALRVMSITSTVFVETKAASRAAALSFSSLLGLGPLVALTVLIAGFALDKNDPHLAANTLSRVIYFVAPQVGQYSKLAPTATPPADGSASTRNQPAQPRPADPATVTRDGANAPALIDREATGPDMALNPQLVEMMDNFINQGRSGSAGAVGFFGLVIIVLMLFKTVEDTFNEIWGVRSGRSVLMRIVYYWTILTLGAVLFFASFTLLSVGALITVFDKTVGSHLPFSDGINVILQWSVPAFSFALLVMLLTVFYRVIPNTRVFWRAALIGAIVVAFLLSLNQFLAFLYVRRVLQTQSLYGSLGFPLVMMFGLYIFWLYVLVGGQISYAVQNVHFRNSQAAWRNLSEAMRERLLLVVLLTIGRRFHDCRPPVAASHLGRMIKVPTQILNECLNRLVDLKLITPLPAARKDDPTDLLYQPARPLNRITLIDFKRLDDNYGDDPTGRSLEQLDPILVHYNHAMDQIAEQDFMQKTLEQHFCDTPFEASHPPIQPIGRP